jgi:hypothetical protein
VRDYKTFFCSFDFPISTGTPTATTFVIINLTRDAFIVIICIRRFNIADRLSSAHDAPQKGGLKALVEIECISIYCMRNDHSMQWAFSIRFVRSLLPIEITRLYDRHISFRLTSTQTKLRAIERSDPFPAEPQLISLVTSYIYRQLKGRNLQHPEHPARRTPFVRRRDVAKDSLPGLSAKKSVPIQNRSAFWQLL